MHLDAATPETDTAALVLFCSASASVAASSAVAAASQPAASATIPAAPAVSAYLPY
jgi:hypothetical protein